MKKLLAKITISSFILAMPFQQSHGIIGGITSIWAPAVGIKIALTGLASPAIGAGAFYIFSKEKGCDAGVCAAGAVLGGIVGLVLLDETESLEFSKLTPEEGLRLNIKYNQLKVYNSEIDEVNLLLKEVASQVDDKTSYKMTRALWEEYHEYLSPETFEVMMTIINNSLQE